MKMAPKARIPPMMAQTESFRYKGWNEKKYLILAADHQKGSEIIVPELVFGEEWN